MPKPNWSVIVGTDDANTLHLSINAETGQLFIAVSGAQCVPRHVATLNRKTKALDNLIDALIEAGEQFDEQQPADTTLNGVREAGL